MGVGMQQIEDTTLRYEKCIDKYGFTVVAKITEGHPNERRLLSFEEAIEELNKLNERLQRLLK